MRLPTGSEPAAPIAVRTTALRKRFGRRTSLGGVDIAVPEGAVYALVGSNGAGKTTLMKILLDLIRPDAGSAEVFGLDVQKEGPRVRSGIGYVPEKHEWAPGWMKIARLFRHYSVYYPMWDSAYAAELMEKFEIDPDKPLQKLSKGQARRVQLLIALAHRPPLLLLDEPTDGLDLQAREVFHRTLAEHLATTETTVLVSTHHLHEVTPLADHLGVLRDGRLTAQLSTDEIASRLRRYRIEMPDSWSEPSALNDVVLEERREGKFGSFCIMGDEREVWSALEASGAHVRDSSPLTLEQAGLALLGRKESR
jgi:ABC-2 type transport system ATP-binding protein